jgi:hypothetical protein
MGLHPLYALSARMSGCVPLECKKNLGEGFLDRLAYAANQATNAVEQLLGYTPYLREEAECVKYPFEDGCCVYPMRQERTDKFKSVRLRENYLLETGRVVRERLAQDVAVTYHDLDGDGIREVARVTYDIGIASDCLAEYQLFFSGREGDAYRIKPVRYVAQTGTVVTLEYDFWDMTLPYSGGSLVALLSKEIVMPDLCCDFDAGDTISASDTTCALARTVDVWRVYVDQTQCPAELTYEGGIDKCGCDQPSCIANTAPSCIQRTGICNTVRLLPATQDTTGCIAEDYCGCRREPDTAKIWYIGGCPDCGINCYNPDTLCHFEAIYWLTLAWADYRVCNCDEDVYDIAKAQAESELFETDSDKYGYSSIVRNNRVGERHAWGLLRDLLRLDQLC